MWEFVIGFLFGRATGVSRFIRPVLILLAIGAVVAGLIYAGVVFKAVNERSRAPNVHTSSTP
jgi:hypothetical protein